MVFITVIVVNKRLILICLVALFLFLTGIVRGQEVFKGREELGGFLGLRVVVSGTVSADPGVAKNNRQTLVLSKPMINEVRQSGDVMVMVSGSLNIRRGDSIQARGLVLDSQNRMPLIVETEDIIVAPGNNPGVIIRDAFADAVRKNVPEPMASLGLGFLVGQKSALPSQLMESIQVLGLSHIIVASGYNLSVFIRFLRPKLYKSSRFSALFGSLGAVWMFTIVTGLSPSMSRAALVATLSLTAWYFGLRIAPLTVIIFTAALTVFYQPGYIHGDIGWYLSYLSFFGVLVVAPWIEKVYFVTKPGALGGIVIETVSALVLTMPISIVIFGSVSPLALFANLFVVPLIPFAMLATFFAGVAGFLPDITGFLAKPAELLIGIIVKIIEYLSALPYAHLSVNISNHFLIVMYGIIFASCVYVYAKTRKIHESFIDAY